MWISRKKHDKLIADLDNAGKALESAQKHAYLVDIERAGRLNKFTFARDGKVYVIESMGLLSDDLREWKEKLLK